MPCFWSVSPPLSSCGRWLTEVSLWALVVWCCERQLGAVPASPTISSRSLCGFVHAVQGLKLLLSLRGDAEGSKFFVLGCVVPVLRKGSSEASLREASVVALSWLPPLMVERRPSQPLSPATVSSGRQMKALSNLQATKPTRRPLCSNSACSRCSVPSGSIPGDGVLGRVAMRGHGGEGAGPDCFSSFTYRVVCAKCRDLTVISLFSLVPIVYCNSTVVNEY
jgi:hypothetical protein